MRRAPVALLKRRAPCPPRRLPRRGVSVVPCNSCRTALQAGIQFAPKLCPEVSLRCHFAVIDRLKAVHSAERNGLRSRKRPGICGGIRVLSTDGVTRPPWPPDRQGRLSRGFSYLTLQPHLVHATTEGSALYATFPTGRFSDTARRRCADASSRPAGRPPTLPTIPAPTTGVVCGEEHDKARRLAEGPDVRAPGAFVARAAITARGS
jgi:hypothetical protein